MISVAWAAVKLLDTYNLRPSNPQLVQWSVISRFLAWLCAELPRLFPGVAAKLRHNVRVTEEEFQPVVNAYKSAVTAPSDINKITAGGVATQNQNIQDTRYFLRHLADQGILPPVTLKRLKGVNFHPTRGIAERPRAGFTAKDIADIKNTVEQLLSKDIGGDAIAKSQREDFVRTLIAERDALEGFRSGGDLLLALKDLNERRLNELRRCMEEVFLHWYAEFQRGQALLEKCDFSYKQDMLPVLKRHIQNFRLRGRGRASSFPLYALFCGVELKLSLARYLKLVDGRWDGIVPTHEKWERELKTFNSKILLKLGGFATIGPLLGPHIEALIAAIVILLIDTGRNVSDVVYLLYDCLEETDDPGIKSLHTWKPRAGNRALLSLIRVNDDNRLSAVEVVRLVKQMTERWHTIASGKGRSRWRNPIIAVHPDAHRYLFIYPVRWFGSGGRLTPGLGSMATRPCSLRAICDRFESLKGIHFTFDSIRPAVAMKHFLDGTLDANSAQTKLCHASKRPTGSYVLRYISKVALERQMREFMREFEAVMIADIPHAAAELGYGAAEFELLLNTALRNGLGAVCLRRITQRQQEDTACDIIRDCSRCTDMRLAVASKTNLADCILLDRYYEDNHEQLRSTNQERFRNAHLPTWALAKATLALAKKNPGVSRGLLADAHEVAATIAPLPPIF
jgi:hypothetical protein